MKKKNNNFTLIELLIVMIILGLLASLVAPKMFGKVDTAKIDTAKIQMENFSTALDTFRLDMDDYPLALIELVSSDQEGWDGPYLPKKVPLDPWKQEYFYKRSDDGRSYTLLSFGKDGKKGGEGINQDVVYQE